MPRPRASFQFRTRKTGSWRQCLSILKALFPAAPYVSLACLRMQTGAACTICLIYTEQFPQAALNLKLPDLCGQPFDAVLVLPCQIIDFLHGVVDLLYARAHFVHWQAASIYREGNIWPCSLPDFACGKLVAFPPRTFLLACLPMQTGADCSFYYHFNGAILAVRPRPIP